VSGRFPTKKRRTTRGDEHEEVGNCRTGTVGGLRGKDPRDVNYPWCIIGNTRAIDCYFSSPEQCMQDGRNRGFGGQCIQNPYYKPGQPPTVSGPVAKRTVLQAARPSQAYTATHSTCTQLKLRCLSSNECFPSSIQGGGMCGGKFCDWGWEHCMQTGWWKGGLPPHPSVERR
jgi:hypothetical protein